MENENPFGNEPLHIPSEQSDRYLPDELGLDDTDEADMTLYNIMSQKVLGRLAKYSSRGENSMKHTRPDK